MKAVQCIFLMLQHFKKMLVFYLFLVITSGCGKKCSSVHRSFYPWFRLSAVFWRYFLLLKKLGIKIQQNSFVMRGFFNHCSWWTIFIAVSVVCNLIRANGENLKLQLLLLVDQFASKLSITNVSRKQISTRLLSKLVFESDRGRKIILQRCK